MNLFEIAVKERLVKSKSKLKDLNELINWSELEDKLKGIHKNEINPQG